MEKEKKIVLYLGCIMPLIFVWLFLVFVFISTLVALSDGL